MIAAHRQSEILNQIIVHGSVRVVDLATRYDVTEETVRRDLDKLVETNKIERSHGGAVALEQALDESPHWRREQLNRAEKNAIACEAASLVTKDETIILDASSTAYYLATHLPNIEMVVITNSSKVAQALAGHDAIKVICLGGTQSPNSLSFAGPIAEKTLSEFYADKAFLSCGSIDLSSGLSDTNEFQASLRRQMLDRSERHYLMADFSKFGKPALANFGSLDDIHVVITDTQTPESTCHEIKKHVEELRVVKPGQIPPKPED